MNLLDRNLFQCYGETDDEYTSIPLDSWKKLIKDRGYGRSSSERGSEKKGSIGSDVGYFIVHLG